MPSMASAGNSLKNWCTPTIGVRNLTLYVSSSDIPAIVDVDEDGDIDVLTFPYWWAIYSVPSKQEHGAVRACGFIGVMNSEMNAGERLERTCPPMLYSWTIRRLHVKMVMFPIQAFLNRMDLTSSMKTKHMPVQAYWPLDIDSSGVKDLVVGDVAFTNLNLLTNSGSTCECKFSNDCS